ncbi:cellulose biosynthesis protein BcsG [Vibrio sp. 99-70-13A1]|uniref:cellulose biosynthesis protein BcsG n=1 Tax=Vibrio sp. 99-70-13A1 TaxID=2607601 RepID=UPI001493CA9A|nr:cellulose biosynthesis protein BcsG [Vibrio sp. 99-70-13A1]NOH98108.1 cellulose biosynthesis protein BcsG [Vibrio sp. 99-70-13A1]
MQSNYHFSQWKLGAWSIYFALKLVLFSQGVIEFDAPLNIALILLLSIPTYFRPLSWVRNTVGCVCAVLLLHHESYLPPLQFLTSQISNLSQFDASYLLSIIWDSLSIELIALIVVLSVGYLYLHQIVKISSLIIVGILVLALKPLTILPVSSEPIKNTNVEVVLIDESKAQDNIVDTSSQGLSDYLNQFFMEQNQEQLAFINDVAYPINFDVLLLNICSLSWDDLEFTGQLNHPLFKQMNITFTEFNSATSYSGPAVLRLLQASCGQRDHSTILESRQPQQCLLFDQLADLGFSKGVFMNHNGEFGGFRKSIGNNIGEFSPEVDLNTLKPNQLAFDGSKLYRDGEVLEAWRRNNDESPSVSLYNTISIHDGNQSLGSTGSRVEIYKRHQTMLLDDLLVFFQRVEESGKNLVVVLIPEHGGALSGDKMQVSGMREIPTKAITHVPVGVRFFGDYQMSGDVATEVHESSSYIAVSKILNNVISSGMYAGQPVALNDITSDLPVTPFVSQNKGTTVIEVNGHQYYTFDRSNWDEYSPN